MAQFSREQIVAEMERSGVIPLFYNGNLPTARQTLQACYEGGARLIEFTNRGDEAYEVFTQLIQFTRKNLPDLMLGVGSITDPETTKSFIEADADFIVSPIMNSQMAEVCNQHEILWTPGCGTLTEIVQGVQQGAEIVKVFPGSHMGPGFISAVLGPCPQLKLMPTGGVTPTRENLQAWFEAGVVCVGMGSKLIKKSFLKEQQFDALKKHVAQTFELAQSVKKSI